MPFGALNAYMITGLGTQWLLFCKCKGWKRPTVRKLIKYLERRSASLSANLPPSSPPDGRTWPGFFLLSPSRFLCQRPWQRLCNGGLYELMRFASDAQSGVVSAAQPNCQQAFHAEDSIECKASPGRWQQDVGPDVTTGRFSFSAATNYHQEKGSLDDQ